MLNIKLSIAGSGSNIDISEFVGNLENRYQNCKFHVNNPDVIDVDFWFVIDDLQLQKESVLVDPEHIYFLTAEHVHKFNYYDSYNKVKFLDQFSKIVSCYDIFRDNAIYDIPFLGWMINANHGSIITKNIRDVNWLKKLTTIEKTRTLSVFCSQKTFTPEHKVRYKFVEILKKHFGDSLDWYGNGIQSIPAKWDGIAPYKYHVVLENQSRHNVISEKIYDSYLGLAYPIYWGAPNLANYFPKESFSQIDILDWRDAIKTIERILLKDEWDKCLPALIKSKNIVTNDLNIYSRLAKLANNNLSMQSSPKQLVELYNIGYMKNSIPRIFFHRTGEALARLGSYMQSVKG